MLTLVTLNTWGGRAGDVIIDFFKNHQDVDIFLLQEVFHRATEVTTFTSLAGGPCHVNLFDDIAKTLPDHIGYFAPAESNEWGLAAFVKKEVPVEEEGHIFVHRHQNALVGLDGSTVGKNVQFLHLKSKEKDFSVLNFHGLWNGQGKSDSDDRISQSRKTIDFAKSLSKDFIIAGDFNLRPDTQSLKMIEEELGLRNLVIEHGITDTRTSLYGKPERYADYILTTPGIAIKDFKVLPDEVSDHAALFLQFG